MKIKLYTSVTNQIIAELEAGTTPWIRPWKTGNTGGILPKNAVTARRPSATADATGGTRAALAQRPARYIACL